MLRWRQCCGGGALHAADVKKAERRGSLTCVDGGISARQRPEARRSGLLVRAEGRAHQSGLAHWARNTGRGGACALQSLTGGISAQQHPEARRAG
jgi:hypothetical protein